MIPRATALPSVPSATSAAAVSAAAGAIDPPTQIADWYTQYASRQAYRLAHDLDLAIAHADPAATIIELGAAPLILTTALRQAGWNVRAVDIAPERFAASAARIGLETFACDIEREALPFPDGSADVVLFNELLEHLRINPVAALKEVHRVLAPGGLLMLSTPNLRSLKGIRNLILHSHGLAVGGDVVEEYGKLELLGHMGHVREYAPGDVVTLLSKTGFRVEEIVYRGRENNLLLRVLPQLRTFATYLARKS